jgi:hypothetical protein
MIPGVPASDNQLQKAIEIIKTRSAGSTRALLLPHFRPDIESSRPSKTLQLAADA